MFLYTNNELSKREIKKTISATLALKGINYLRMNLAKEVKDLYLKIYKISMKEELPQWSKD